MAGNKTYRINKVAAELNVGWKILLEHLSDKGIDVEQKITAKIDQNMYDILCKDYQSDRRAKEESQSLDINVRKKDDVKIAERHVAPPKKKR